MLLFCMLNNSRQRIIIFLPNLSFLAKESIWIVGSDPIDKKQMRGVRWSLSSQVFFKFKMTGSVYFSCKESAIYFLAWERVRSGHQDLQIKNYTKIQIQWCFPLQRPDFNYKFHFNQRYFCFIYIHIHLYVCMFVFTNIIIDRAGSLPSIYYCPILSSFLEFCHK